MKVEVLGCSGAEFPGFNLPGFLIDGKILLDAGTIGAYLSEDAQWKIRRIVVSHAHLDHIRGIPFLADNIIIKNKRHNVTVIGIAPVLKSLKNNLLNNKIWPDFTMIPNAEKAVIRFLEVKHGRQIEINGYKITAYRVNHSVSATGYIIEDRRGKRLLYTGDTGPTHAIWKEAGRIKIHRAIIEVSFPNKMEAMAIATGHLTPKLLKKELDKINILPDKILITHPKPQHLKTIRSEIEKLGIPNIRLLKDGEVINI
ncbi:MAG: 3',5'-cyclic-nucleotide phosphodiesterase [Thermodesulfovibrionales bacterium]|nr:3',5'-cyclic-nucleotide phosphodiesterase [Nitrospinota bacterium]MCG2709696.1 3',5'-cyclic-nucleotide phosphodiesterase [Thermodesulfovibrionales bacterium]MCG2813431.1 3',5'-cyclic-nucleotide phosphodiesterase [Thermodesulfovibrionales bacterium]